MLNNLSFKPIVTVSKLVLLLAFVSVLSGCGKQEVVLSEQKDDLAKRTITQGGQEVIYPDDDPSVPDGKVVWEKMNCATCHGATGSGSAGKCSRDLTNREQMRKEKPVDQYEFVYFGRKGLDHPAVKDQVSRRQAWDLVFYVRSLSCPALAETDPEYAGIDEVFGSNCAVCHGKKGYGDGPIGKHLEPQPANFQNFARFYDRSDIVLWDHIANGIKWEGMPNFLGKEDKAKNVKFDQAYIWKLVQYVRHFHETTRPTIAQNALNNAGTVTK
jgi:mono/diheme cytochrome c family protein